MHLRASGHLCRLDMMASLMRPCRVGREDKKASKPRQPQTALAMPPRAVKPGGGGAHQSKERL
eukprot:scaffold534488_cov55-Prasinocladus_malaysianus.AAC.1